MDGEKQLIRKLQETLGKMELALGSIGESIVWTDASGTIQWCNKSFDLLAAKPHITLLGKQLNDVLPVKTAIFPGRNELDSSHIDLLKEEALIESVHEYSRSERTAYLEITRSRARISGAEDLFIFSIRDVTELTLSQRALSKARDNLEARVAERTEQLRGVTDRYKNILFEAVDAIITINPEGIIGSFNPAAERIFGYKASDVIGENVTMLMPSPHSMKHDAYIKKYIQTGRKKIIGIGREVVGLRRNGEHVPLYLAVSEVRIREQITFTGILRDISDQKKAEKALREAKNQADAANRAKSDFLANMSHEIRTPMNAVLGFSDLLADLIKDRKQKRYLEAIRTSGKGLLTIINDILDLSKIEAGKLDLHYESVNLKKLLSESTDIFLPSLAEKDVELSAEVDSGVPENLMLDEIRLRQVLINLIGNAVKFTHQGYIRLTAKATGLDGEKAELHIYVEDTGSGIEPSQQELIFGAFDQQAGAARNEVRGTGLGLTISRRLVEMMNGRILLTSEPGCGSIFHVCLREVKYSAEKPRIKAEPLFDSAEYSFEPAVVLVVDDVASNRELIQEMLSPTALEVIEAENGREALAVIRTNRPDLVLLDIRMPVMDGYETQKIMKSDDSFNSIPVIGVTASVVITEKTNLDFAGFDGFLTKPVSRRDLLLELRRFLQTKEEKKGVKDRELPEAAARQDNVVAKDEMLISLEALKSRIQQFSGAIELDSVLSIAGELMGIGEKHKASAVKQYGLELRRAADQFRIARVKELLKSFSELTAKFKE